MPEENSIADYNLLILDRLISRCATLAALQQAIASYPEDTKREGHVIADIQQFVAGCGTLAEVVEAANRATAKRGGKEGLEQILREMELWESINGWDE